MEDLVLGADGVVRCGWSAGDELYRAYHDDLFEVLSLEGFQAGLAWITILRKRTAFRAAFAGFEIARVAGFDERDVSRLVADAGIVRHRGKIEAVIGNAQAALDLPGGLSALVWAHAPAPRARRPASLADVPAVTPESTALSKELKRRGFRFVGPTTVYAFMQAAGLVDDHLAGCAVAP